MKQELDKLFLLIQKACGALARTHKIFIVVSNPTEDSIQSSEQTSVTKNKYIPTLVFEAKIKDKKTENWRDLGKFVTWYTENGELAVPSFFKETR